LVFFVFSNRYDRFALDVEKLSVRRDVFLRRSARRPFFLERPRNRTFRSDLAQSRPAPNPKRAAFRRDDIQANRREKFPASILFIFHFFSFSARLETPKPALFRFKSENFKKTFFSRFKIEKLRRIYRRRRRFVDRATRRPSTFGLGRRSVLGVYSRFFIVETTDDKKRRVPTNETRRRRPLKPDASKDVNCRAAV
jgi:hypothetical protein